MNLALLFFCCMATRSAIEAPKPKMEHRFYDRPAKIELALALTADGFDNAASCNFVDHDGQKRFLPSGAWTLHREDYLPTQTCLGITAFLTAELAGQEALAYLLHRTHHHKLERVIRFVTIAGNTRAIIHSKQHGVF